ncbi:MAG: 3-methyl-2-oxobutanoate hydroxymethyltransferase [Candidatus Cloacimonetes bacterium]|jgi:3-methyl-2-oxobutanoate hydroxymethyltransferase|nr:3-methyl-2-oxobutanoate hydroxymethyltransferase [Candidatus Cloacimonadota bacterium]
MSTDSSGERRRVTIRDLLEMKKRGERIVVLTAYDVLFARIVDEAGTDVILVGDSLAQVVLGLDSTLPVTLDDMIHHGRAVRRGVQRGLLVVDMPFMTFQVSPEETLRNAGRIMKETGAEAVKLEGGDEQAAAHVARLVRAGIPVMGHIGLTPQSVHALGGFRVQGREEVHAERLRQEALRLQDAGAFSVVLELVPGRLAGEISRSLEIPTIGIGAGADCDGQVLVLPDMLGLNEQFKPKFLKRFAELAAVARQGVGDYVSAVRDGSYPGPEHTFE